MSRAGISRNDQAGIYVFLLIQTVKVLIFSVIRYLGGHSAPAAFSAGAVPAAGITSVLVMAAIFGAILFGKCINIRAVVTYAFMAELVIAIIFFTHGVRTVYHLTFMRVYILFIGFWILFIVSEFVMVHACIIIWNKDGTENGGDK